MKFRNWFQLFLVIGSIVPAVAVDGVWIDTASSNVWSDASNWEGGIVPGSEEGDTADLQGLVSNGTVTVDRPIILASLLFHGKLLSSGEGAITLKGVDGAPALLKSKYKGTALTAKPACGFVLESDLDIELQTDGYNRFGLCIGPYDIHLNRSGSSKVLYADTISPAFVGNWYIHGGTLMTANEPFGATTGGVRRITLLNAACLRINGNGELAANRALHIDETGGTIKPNGRNLKFKMENGWLTGSGNITLSDDGNFGGSLSLHGTNEAFTGSIFIGQKKPDQSPYGIVKLTDTTWMPNAKEFHLAMTNSVVDATARQTPFSFTKEQILSGIGIVKGSVRFEQAVLMPSRSTVGVPANFTNPLHFTDDLSMESGSAIVWTLHSIPSEANAETEKSNPCIIVDGRLTISDTNLKLVFPAAGDGENPVVSDPDSGDGFWQTEHKWPLVKATGGAAMMTGLPRVENGNYARGAFRTYREDDTIWLHYLDGLGTTVIVIR